jgi:hypothetical protein
MAGVTQLAAKTAVSEDDVSFFGGISGLRLPSALQTIATSSAIALLAGFSAFIGRAMANGRNDALGLYALTPTPIDQRDIYVGILLITGVLINIILIIIAFRVSYLAIRYFIQMLIRTVLASFAHRLKVPTAISRHLGWIALAVATANSVLLVVKMGQFLQQSHGMLMKSLNEIGTPWSQMLSSRLTAGMYTSAYSIFLALQVGATWWFITDVFQPRRRRGLVAILSAMFIILSITEYAYLQGALSTFNEYPMVVVPSQKETFGEHSISVLLGQDDKVFAFLVVKLGDSTSAGQKMLVYLARDQVKSMSVLRMVSVQQIDHYDELKRELPADAPKN